MTGMVEVIENIVTGEVRVIDERSIVRFRLGTGNMDYIDVSLRDGYIDIRGGIPLAAYPHAANALRVGLPDGPLSRFPA